MRSRATWPPATILRPPAPAASTPAPSAPSKPRSAPTDRTRGLSRDQVEALLGRADLALRERTLWRLLYETAARAGEVLALDIEGLDVRNRCAKVRRKGNAVDVIVWQTGTARLLPRLLKGRTSGLVFLTDRRARVELPPGDLDPTTGRARLIPPRGRTVRAGHRRLPRRAVDAAPAPPLGAHPRCRGRRQHRHPAGLLRAHLGRLAGPLRPRLTRGAGWLAAATRPRPTSAVGRPAGCG